MKSSPTLISQQNVNRKSAFSLIEILIVIGLIAMLATLVISNVSDTFGKQGEKIADMFVSTSIKLPLTEYRLDVGSYPSTAEGLAALITAPAGKESRWRGPYVEELPADPWKQPYQYRYPGTKNISKARGYDAWSWGPDGSESGDDIGNWK